MAETKSTKKSWLDVYKANYEGTSDEAKSVKEYLKENYKGNSYIPWATMERLTYMQDPDAVFEKLTTENGQLVHTSYNTTEQEVIADGVVKNSTKAKVVAHFVKVKLTFMGKEFVEDYPIQDSSYEAVKAYDSNLVNKALQRALAKVASRGTGIGLKLYENKDLQFEEKEEVKKPEIKPVVKKETPKVEMTEEQKVANIMDGGETAAFLNGERTFVTQDVKPAEEPNIAQVAQEVLEEKANSEIDTLVDLILNSDKEKMTKVLKMLNTAIITKFGFALNLEDTREQLVEKVSKFEDVSKFTKAVETQLNRL